jgi:hypothetical protein
MNELKKYILGLTGHRRQAVPSGRQAGFTLLIAALVASIVLTIASAIFSITQKQIVLASLSQQSQYAFYAADTASECALYWDERYNYFGTTTPSGGALPYAPVCNGQSIALTPALSSQTYNQPSCYYAPGKKNLPCYVVPSTQLPVLNLFTTAQHSFCAKITVTKFLDSSTNPSTTHTIIDVDGYNIDCADIATSKSALERSVELNY